jgi:hypothetical protein
VIGVGVGLITSVAAFKDGSASEAEKESYLQKGLRGLKTLRESFDSDKVNSQLSCSVTKYSMVLSSTLTMFFVLLFSSCRRPRAITFLGSFPPPPSIS